MSKPEPYSALEEEEEEEGGGGGGGEEQEEEVFHVVFITNSDFFFLTGLKSLVFGTSSSVFFMRLESNL